ncbi:hypothetical protein SKAU_G00006910 [Synaphobranchus kaupii]|uniref:Uncharacterized protein n=1 Tax=Synaphobranchus kaupii TaxID=118154 RepID=A0A9Q1GA54_SYNKA|nr:hypothetical protein SKAU_G00006910 [Synaphobranchus kaupii]
MFYSRFRHPAGIGGSALAWIESYLSECSSQVAWAGKVSAPRPLTTGVPQGLSPLVPSFSPPTPNPLALLSLLMVFLTTAMLTILNSFSPSHPLTTQVSARISACLRDIQSWMDNHHLKRNPGKTELIYIPALTSPPLNLSISLGDTPLAPTPCARNLGVVMDNRLSLSENIAVVTRPFLTTHSTQLLVQAMVLSRLGLLQLSPSWTASIGH